MFLNIICTENLWFIPKVNQKIIWRLVWDFIWLYIMKNYILNLIDKMFNNSLINFHYCFEVFIILKNVVLVSCMRIKTFKLEIEIFGVKILF